MVIYIYIYLLFWGWPLPLLALVHTHARMHTNTHTHTHTLTLTQYRYMHYWWWVGRMRRKKTTDQYAEEERWGFNFDLREWRQIPDSSDRERKSSIITVSHCLKCSLSGFDPSPVLILCNRSTDNEKLCTSSNYRPADFCHNWLHCDQSCFPLLALMGNQLFVLISVNNYYSS